MTNDEIFVRLERMAEHAVHTVGEKPYVIGLDDGIALYFAIKAINAHQPRVLTLEEVPDAVFCYLEYKAYGTIEPAIFGEADIDDTVAFTTLEDGKDYLDLSDYCKAWRCWTAMPTDEQREAVKWE